jgi:hypothetical protein
LVKVTDRFGNLAYEVAKKDTAYDGVETAGDILAEKCDLEELRSIYDEAKDDPEAFGKRLAMRLYLAIEREEKRRIESGLCPVCEGELRRDVYYERYEAHGARFAHPHQGQAYCLGCGWRE